MMVDLDKEDLIALVTGQEPNYRLIPFLEKMDLGHFRGGHYDEWVWRFSGLDVLSDEQLFDIYKRCKESWKKRL